MKETLFPDARLSSILNYMQFCYCALVVLFWTIRFLCIRVRRSALRGLDKTFYAIDAFIFLARLCMTREVKEIRFLPFASYALCLCVPKEFLHVMATSIHHRSRREVFFFFFVRA